MQAQFVIRRSPTVLFSILFAIAVAVLIGGTLGYLLKPANIVSGPGRVVVVSTSSGAAAADEQCIWTANPHQKAC
jgi:hypothetical protein